MPFQKGTVRIKGMVHGMVFYKSQDGYLIRRKTSVDKHRIRKDPAFARTRETNDEFRNASNAGALLFRTVSTISKGARGRHLISRLTAIMCRIKDFDTTHERGKRTIAEGISIPSAKQLLKGFNFNQDALLDSTLVNSFTLDRATGKITIPDFVPVKALITPEGATHVSFQSAFVQLDFSRNVGEMQVSPPQNLRVDTTPTTVVLMPAIPALTGTSIYLLKVSFFQLVNGVSYAHNDASALAIIDLK